MKWNISGLQKFNHSWLFQIDLVQTMTHPWIDTKEAVATEITSLLNLIRAVKTQGS